MLQKKLPNRSKIVIAVLAFLLTFYLLFVGYDYMKSWNDFKPYHKLAVELNEDLGGGYAITENKNCGIDTPDCPSVELKIEFSSIDLAGAISKKEEIKKAFVSKSFAITEDQECKDDSGDISFCGISALNENSNLFANVGIGNQFISIDIHKP